MTADFALQTSQVERAYSGWAPIYDAICGPILRPGIRAVAQAARESGTTVLEVGVGTGLSFSEYHRDIELYGVDVCEPMLRRAQAKARDLRGPKVKSLRIMDAHCLEYRDGTFDAVVAPFLITLVADPARVLSEAVRVVRCGGRVLLINHFHSEPGLLATLERASGPMLRKVGLNPDFSYDRIREWMAADSRVRVVQRKAVTPFFSLVSIERHAST